MTHGDWMERNLSPCTHFYKWNVGMSCVSSLQRPMHDACNLWVTSTCVHVCLLAEVWGGKGESPFPLQLPFCFRWHLVLHMLNALGGSRCIEMKKAPAVVASWGARWDGDQSKVTGLQEERLVFCLSALAVEMSDGKGVWRGINDLHSESHS